MSDLIARLQSLTEPSREIDAEIFERFGKINEDHCRSWCRMDGRTDLTRAMFIRAWAPRYTEIINDALTLMPPQMTWSVGKWSSRSGDEPSVYWADLHQDPEEHWAARHPLPAIALLIAREKVKESAEAALRAAGIDLEDKT